MFESGEDILMKLQIDYKKKDSNNNKLFCIKINKLLRQLEVSKYEQEISIEKINTLKANNLINTFKDHMTRINYKKINNPNTNESDKVLVVLKNIFNNKTLLKVCKTSKQQMKNGKRIYQTLSFQISPIKQMTTENLNNMKNNYKKF